MIKLPYFLAGTLLGILLTLLLLAGVGAVIAAPDLRPAPVVHQVELEPTPTALPTAAPAYATATNPQTAVGPLGWAGHVECWNCAPFIAQVKLSHYDPMKGKINCWDYDEAAKYCYSPTILGVPWKSVWGIAAACPVEWKLGTWVVIPTVGAYICLDRGNEIVCNKDGLCNVDLLGPGGEAWDGQIVTANLWVPLDPPRGEN